MEKPLLYASIGIAGIILASDFYSSITKTAVDSAAVVASSAQPRLEHAAPTRSIAELERVVVPADMKSISWRTVVKPDDLFPQRRVTVGALLGLAEITGKDVRSTNPEEQKNLASQHAPEVARAECARLERILAAKCVVDEAGATLRGPDRFLVRMNLLFTSRDPFGAVASPEQTQWVEIPEKLAQTGGAGAPVLRGAQAAEREAIYTAAARACETRRREKGNCALLDIDIAVTPEGKAGDVVRLEGKATMMGLQRGAFAAR